ncbi:MAG: hypothetical protein ACK5NK_04940 [Niabella sp.]
MVRKRAIKRMFLTLMWIGVAAVMFTIISSAMEVQNTSKCKGYEVKITGAQENRLFTSEDKIVKLLKTAAHGEVTGQRINEFDLPVMEDLLEQSAWVYNAELYFDNKDILHVNVIERKPLARVFANNGESFYIDEAGKHIPLSDKISLDVPAFTGYPIKKEMNAHDSLLLQNMIATASFINNDSFWSSQVSQINIDQSPAKEWQMEMVPVVGNHVVLLGDGSDIATKFHRLYLFYDQVLKRKGFDKYAKIDVQYSGQVVGVKDSYTKVDSIQLRKNIEKLLLQARESNELMEDVTPTGNRYVMDTSAASKAMYKAVETDDSDTVVASKSIDAVPKVKNKTAVKEVESDSKKASEKNTSGTTVKKSDKTTQSGTVRSSENTVKKSAAKTDASKKQKTTASTKETSVKKKTTEKAKPSVSKKN